MSESSIMQRSIVRGPLLWMVLLTIICNSLGQILFQAAQAAHPDASLLGVISQPGTWAAFLIYGLSAAAWLWVLSRAQLSLVYPLLSLTFPIVVGLSAILFTEAISPPRWAGVGMVVLGVSLLAKS